MYIPSSPTAPQIWAVIGIQMYLNEMSAKCREEDAAKMVLAWSVIQFAMLPFVCLIMICAQCCDSILDPYQGGEEGLDAV